MKAIAERHRISPRSAVEQLAMPSFDQAISLLADHVIPLGCEEIALEHAAGRYLAEDLCARSNSPRADVSVMDGYAVVRYSTSGDSKLVIVGESRPGAPYRGALGKRDAVRIFTGATVPEGADCVIMQEYARLEESEVSFAPGHGPSTHIRRVGSDFRAGDVLLARGIRLTPPALVAASAADRANLTVAKRPRVAIIATGDELARPGDAYRSDTAIPDSISYAITDLCRTAGAEVISMQRCPDDLHELRRLARDAVAAADCIVVTGGASVGDHDLARPMFAETGMELIFSKLAIKPGRPVWFGLAGSKCILGLPGNPTSAMVTARLFLRPLLAALQGGRVEDQLAFMPLGLAASLPAAGNRETFFRATWTADGLVPATNQLSGAQSPLATADWLIRRPAGSAAAEKGEQVEALPF